MRDVKTSSWILSVMLAALIPSIWGSARSGHWHWFALGLFEFWVLGGVLFRFAMDAWNAAQRRRRARVISK